MADRLVGAQELFVAFALDLDQVRHLHHFVDIAEDLADTPFGAVLPRVVASIALVAMCSSALDNLCGVSRNSDTLGRQ